MLVIKNGYIVLNNQLVKKDLLIDEGKIIKISNNIEHENNYIDASGCLVMPGAVDVHVHLREPGFIEKETIKTGTLSAAKGGVTTIMSMPNLKPCPDNIDALNKQLDIIKKDALVNVFPYGSVSIDEKDQEIKKNY